MVLFIPKIAHIQELDSLVCGRNRNHLTFSQPGLLTSELSASSYEFYLDNSIVPLVLGCNKLIYVFAFVSLFVGLFFFLLKTLAGG